MIIFDSIPQSRDLPRLEKILQVHLIPRVHQWGQVGALFLGVFGVWDCLGLFGIISPSAFFSCFNVKFLEKSAKSHGSSLLGGN